MGVQTLLPQSAPQLTLQPHAQKGIRRSNIYNLYNSTSEHANIMGEMSTFRTGILLLFDPFFSFVLFGLIEPFLSSLPTRIDSYSAVT